MSVLMPVRVGKTEANLADVLYRTNNSTAKPVREVEVMGWIRMDMQLQTSRFGTTLKFNPDCTDKR